MKTAVVIFTAVGLLSLTAPAQAQTGVLRFWRMTS
jgi:hypothetical protein